MAKLTKEEKAAKKAQRAGLIKEFKAFITRGNVLDLAVGVIIGAAFNAIVTALVNILMSIATWGVPGGIKGLVTVLPAASNTQKGLAGVGQKFKAADFNALATKIGKEAQMAAGVKEWDIDYGQAMNYGKDILNSKYTLHGTTYTYNLSAVIDWGNFINAIISFIIIALTLFVIIKVTNKMKAYREGLKAKIVKPKEEVQE